MKTNGALILSVVMFATDTTASPARNARRADDMAASGQKASAFGGFFLLPDTQPLPYAC
jgi:hypothetical protein